MSYDTSPADGPDSAYKQWVEAREEQGDTLVLDYATDTSVARTPEGERPKYRNPADYAIALCMETGLATY
jgi:hypothetical protein